MHGHDTQIRIKICKTATLLNKTNYITSKNLLNFISVSFGSMRYFLAATVILFCSLSAFGEEQMECPNRQTDPSKFCLPGQAWNEEIKKCVNLV